MISEKDRLERLLRSLLNERPEYSKIAIPDTTEGMRELLRALMNVREPAPVDADTLRLQDEELAAQREEKGVVDLSGIAPSPLYPELRLWQGDITRLCADAIVNAANSRMLGCFVPLHRCIDNAIHSAAGMELREECDRIMHSQGHPEPTGCAKITHGYNLPAKWVIHTVGPIVYGPFPTEEDCMLLGDCYRNCLALADEYKLESIAFCCISTGEFRFPHARAAEIAVSTVREYMQSRSEGTVSTVVFNVFKDEDYRLYKKLLGYE